MEREFIDCVWIGKEDGSSKYYGGTYEDETKLGLSLVASGTVPYGAIPRSSVMLR
jgi:hypothetical protein